VGIWLAPNAYAAPQDQPFLSFLATHNVAIDTNTAINAAHVACAQIVNGETNNTTAAVVSRQFPTINGNEYWIVAGAHQAYCP
jgi:glutaminase